MLRTVISSPSSSTTGLSTLIFWMGILVVNVRESELVTELRRVAMLVGAAASRVKDDVADTREIMCTVSALDPIPCDCPDSASRGH